MSDIRSLLIETLKTDDRLIVNGSLAKNKVIELALQLDVDLLKLLLSSKELTEIFFEKVGEVTVFDKIKFQSFVSNKQFLPDSFTEYKNEIGLATEKGYLAESKEVVLAFPYKDCVLEGGQTKEDAKRNEIFWNETLASNEIDQLLQAKALTNFKRIDQNGEIAVDRLTKKDNLIIRGNNLLALHCLQKQFAGEVKLIYIDPPYNTGTDSFQYNDSFNHSTWLTFMRNRLMAAKRLLREDGVIFVQCDDSEQAYLKVLMDEIFKREHFISLIVVKVKSSAGASGGGEDRKLKKNYENLLTYSRKNFSSFKKIYESDYLEDILISKAREHKTYEYNKVLISVGNKKEETHIETGQGKEVTVYKHSDYKICSVKSLAKEEGISEYEVYQKYFDKIFRTQDAQSSIRHKVVTATHKEGGLYSITYVPISGKSKGKETELFYYKNEMVNFFSNVAVKVDGEIIKNTILGTLWTDIAWDGIANEGGVKLKAGKKPERLLQRIIEMCTEEGDLILDYHLGSGTTCAVAHKLGRRYIGIEQLDYGNNDSIIRLKEVLKGDNSGISKSINWKGGGSFIYAELAQANQLFIERIQLSKDSTELSRIWEDMKEKAFLSYKVKPENIDSTKKDFEDLMFEDQQRFLISILDKNLLYVPYSEIDDKTWNISEEDKKLNHQFYSNL